MPLAANLGVVPVMVSDLSKIDHEGSGASWGDLPLLDIGKAFAKRAILVPFGAYVLLLTGAVFLAYGVELWTPKLLTPTVFWFLLSGSVLFFGITNAGKDDRFFRKILFRMVSAGALLESFVGIKTFHLLLELLLQPVVVCLVLVATVAATKPEFRPAKVAAESPTAIIALLLVALTIRSLVAEPETFDVGKELRQFALPVWLTVVSLPFIYLLALYAEHETAFIRMSFGPVRRKPSARSRLAVMIGLRGRLTEVHGLSGPWASRVGQERGLRGALVQVRAFRGELQARRVAEQEAVDRLHRYAGIDGVDEVGRRLDRRGFQETCKALEWLATCQMGWYRRDEPLRYRDDLLDRLGDFVRHGLPEPHGIGMRVSRDGQAWYAYRRTVSGWVFAIGAAGPPPDQWRFDGPQPPAGPPGEDSAWGSDRFVDSRNWA